MRVRILTTIIFAFAECLLSSENQETENGTSQHPSLNPPLSSSPVKAVVNQTSLSQATKGNSSGAEGAGRYLLPFKAVRRHRPLYAGANHTFPAGVASRSYSPGLSTPMEGRSNKATSTEVPQNSSSPISKTTQYYYDGSVETHHSMPISSEPQSSLPVFRAVSSFLPLPRTTHLSLPISSIGKPSALDTYTTDSGATDLFSPVHSETHNSGPGSRETFSSPPDTRAVNYSVPTSHTTLLSMPIFRTRYRFRPTFTARHHSVPDSHATQNASHKSQYFPNKHVQIEPSPSLDQTGFKEMRSLPLSHWPVPSQSLSKVPIMPRTTKLPATSPKLSLKPVIRHSLPTLKGSSQSSFVPDSENYSSSFSILSGHPRSTSVERNSFNVDQDRSSYSSNAPTSNLLPVKAAKLSLPLSFRSGNLPRTKVIWNKSPELKPYPLIPYNSLGKDRYLLANGRTGASQSPWNTTAPSYPQAKPSSLMPGYTPLSHSASIPEAPTGTTTDTIIRILDSNTPISLVNTNNETPRLKIHEEETTTNVADFFTVGGNAVTHTEDITELADATPWDKKANTTAYHATGYSLNPENLANDFLKDSTNTLTGVHNFSDDGTYKEKREGDGIDLDNAAPSVGEDNSIIMDSTDLLEEDFRALVNTLEFLGEDDFIVVYVSDWEEGYLTDDDDPIVLKEDSIDEMNTRSFTKGMTTRSKLPIGINDAAMPMKNVIPFTTPREIPEDVAVPTSNAVSEDVATNPTDDAVNFFPKTFMRKYSAPIANKHLAFTTGAENSMPTGNPVTSEANGILSIRNSEIPKQQIILTQLKPQIILPENEHDATGNAHTVLLENTTAPDKNVTVYMTQLWGDNSVIENNTTLPKINITIPTGRMPSLTNVPTRPIPDVAIVGTADPLLNIHSATPMKEAINKAYYTITMEDDPTMSKGQQISLGRVIPRSSTITPREDVRATLYGLPRMDGTFANGDTAFEGDVSLSAKARTEVEADKVILAEENIPKDNTLRTFLSDDNDPKSAKDDSFSPCVNTAEHLVDRTKHATNPTQSDPKGAISTVHISPSMSDRTVKTSRKVYSVGSADVIPFVEENPESEMKASVSRKFRDDPNSRDVTSRSMGGGRTSNQAKTSTEDTTTENKLKPNVEYYGGSEKGTMPNILPTSFVFGSDDTFDVNDSDTMGFYSFQKEYGTAFFPLGDKATIPKGSYSSLTQVLDSKVDTTPLLYEMTNRNPNVALISNIKKLKPMATRNMADVTTDGIEEINLKDQEIATVKHNDEAAEDVKFFLPDNFIPGIRREGYAAFSDTDHGLAVRQTTILLDDNIKPAVISPPLWPKTSVSTTMEVAMDLSIKPVEKAPPKETEDSILTMNYINANTTMEEADPAKLNLLTANTFKPDVSSANLQEAFHEKEDPFPPATRQPSELSAKNLAKIKDTALPEWQLTESNHNVLPSETAFFPAALTTSMIEPISGEHEPTSIVNGKHATQDGGASEFKRDEKSTILERTRRITALPAFRANIVTVIDTTRDESENGETFEYEVIPHVERTTTIEGKGYISDDDLSIDFSPTSDDCFDVLVTEDDSILPETDGISPSTDIFANPPNLKAFEAPVDNFVSDVTKSLPKTTAPGLKEIIIHGQHSKAIPDTTSFLPKISHLGEKRSIHKDTAPNVVSSFTPAYTMPLTSNSAEAPMNPITLEDEGISVTESTPTSSNNKLSLRVRITSQATHLKPQDDNNSSVAEITKSQKGNHTKISATDPGSISHTDDVTGFVRSPTTPTATSLIQKATPVKAAAPAISTENTEPKDGLASVSVNDSPSMGDKDVLDTADAPQIFKDDSVPEEDQGPFLINPAWRETIRNKSVSIQSPAVTPEWLNIEEQTLVPDNAPLDRFHASYHAPIPATIVVPWNSTVRGETSSLLSDNIITPSGQVVPMAAATSSKGDSGNMGNVNKYELEPHIEKGKAFEPETLHLTERPTIVEVNDAILPTKNVRENVEWMISLLHDNIPKDYGSISEDARIALKTADTKPIMDSASLTYDQDGFEAPAINSLSRIIILPSDVGVIENHHTIFVGEDNSDKEGDKSNLRTTDDSNFSWIESSTLASLDMVAIAANDVDFLSDKSNPRVKKNLHSSSGIAPDTILDRTNTNPYIIDTTDSNRKDELPLIKNDYRSAIHDAVGLQAATTTIAADLRTQEDETNTAGLELIDFPLGMDPVTSFIDSVIDELPDEREGPLTDPMTKGAIKRAERARLGVGNGTVLPVKETNAEGKFDISVADTDLFTGDTPPVTSETLSLLPDVTPDEDQLSAFTEEESLAGPSMIVASKLSEPVVGNTQAINEAADPRGQIFESHRDPWALPQQNRLLTADPTSSGLFPRNSEHSVSTTGNRVAIDEMDAPLVTTETLSLLPDVTPDEDQLSVFTEDPLTDASMIVASEVWEPVVENTETTYEAADTGRQIFEPHRDPWALPEKNRFLTADPTSSGIFPRNFEDSISTTGNRVAIAEMDSSDAPLVTSETLSLLLDITADEPQTSAFTEEDSLASPSRRVASKLSEPVVGNTETINEAADPRGQIFESQSDPWALPLELADSTTSKFSLTSSERSSPNMAAAISMPVKYIPSSTDGPRDNSERLFLETRPSEESSSTDVETTTKEEIMTQSEGNLPYGMAYNDFVSGNAVNRTGVSATNSLISTYIKMTVGRDSATLRRERVGIESHGTKSPNEKTNSKIVATGSLVKASPGVQEIAFVEEKSEEADKIASSFLPDTRGPENGKSFHALSVGDTSPFNTDSTASGTMPNHETLASSKDARGPTDHTSGAPATATAAGVKAHAKEGGRAVAEITNHQNDILPVTSTRIPESEGISHVADGTDWVTVAIVPGAYAEYTEAENNQAISEVTPSLSTGYGGQPRTPAYTDTDTVGTVKEDPGTEPATFGEKYPSSKRAIFTAAPFNWREDNDFRIRATPYKVSFSVEEMASDEDEEAFHREEEDTMAEEDDTPQEGESTLDSTYSSPFMSGNNILEGKNLDPEEGSIFYEANNNHVIIDAINPPPQIIIHGEIKAGDSISPGDKKPSTVGASAAQTADDNIKNITADSIPDQMTKMTAEFKGITNVEHNYSEAENNRIFLPVVAYLTIKRKAQKDGEVGPDADSLLASKDIGLPMEDSTGPVPFATLLEDTDSSKLVPGDHATNTVTGAKFPEQETKTAMVEMVDSQNDTSPVISFRAPTDVRMPYANIGNEYRKDLAVNAAIPLTRKALAMLAKDAMLPSEYIQPNSESTASEVDTTVSREGGPLTALTKPIHKHLAPSDKSQINHHGRDMTPITFETLESRADNSLPNDAATMGQSLTKMEADLPSFPLVPTFLPHDSVTSINKAMYPRLTAATTRKEDARTAKVPDISITSTNVPEADIRDRINTSTYQPDIIIEESASMEYDEIPFIEEDTSIGGDIIYLEEENTSNDDLMTLVLGNNVSVYVTEDYIIAPPSPIIKTSTLTYGPSELGMYASYNKADSLYSSPETATVNPTQTNSPETSHTVIPEYEPPDSEIYTTMLKSVVPWIIAYASSDGSKKMPSNFLKITAMEQNNKVVDDATTFLPVTSNPKKKRTDSSIVLDPYTGFPIEDSKTFTMDNVGSAGKLAPIKNKDVLDTNNLAADAFTSEKNPSVTAFEGQNSKENFKTIGSETSTARDSTSHSELLMSPETNRISHMDENVEMVTDVITTANMPATGKVASVGVLPVQDGDSPVPKADFTMFLYNNPLRSHENPSLIPDAKTESAAASLQGKTEALLDDFFLVSEETGAVVEQMETSIEDDTSVPEISLSKDANRLISEDNIIQVEESLPYDVDLIGGDNSNSEDDYIILEPNVPNLNVVVNSCLTNTNELETTACMDFITFVEKNGEDEFYAKNLPADKTKVPMETTTMIDVIADGIKTTPQEMTTVEEGNRDAVKVTSFEPDVPLPETTVHNYKGSYIASDWDPIFTTTDTSTFMTWSNGLAEDITFFENQETSIPKDARFSYTTDRRAESITVTATDATSEEKEVAEITNLENDVTPTFSFIPHKTKDTESVINSGIANAVTSEEETPMPMFSASTLYTGYIKPKDDPIVSEANSVPVSIDDTLLKEATVDNPQETLPSKEMLSGDVDMTMLEASGPVSEKPLPVNEAPTPEWNVINSQRDSQALQLESTLPPDNSTPLPRTPAHTDADTTLYTGYIKPKDDPIVSEANSVPVSMDDTLLKEATVHNPQETLPSKEMLSGDADMTMLEASGPVSEKPLPVNEAPTPEWNVINSQRDSQALQLESTLPPDDSTPLPRTPAHTDADTDGTVKEDLGTETVTSGEKYPSHKGVISAAATMSLREDTDFMTETARSEADISVEIRSDEHEVAFHREEENAIAEDNVTQEENTPYTIDFSTYISSGNILKGNVLDPQDYSIFLKREAADSISEVNKITPDLSKFAQPAGLQKSIPIMTSFPVPGADRISFGNQDSETASYSDLTGDMSSMAQANPTMAKAPIPTSLPNGSGDDFLLSRSGTAKSSESTTLSVDSISIPEDEFTSKKIQDTLLAKDGSLADMKMAKSYLLNLVTDHSAPMTNLGILEGSITKTPAHLHAFPLDASRENTISSVDSTYTEYDSSTTREDTISEMSFDDISTSPASSSPEEMLRVTSVTDPVPEDPPLKVYSPTPTTDIAGNIIEEAIFSMGDESTPKIQRSISSEGGHLTSLDDSTPERDLIATAVNFMTSFSSFISSVADRLTLSKEVPASEFESKLHHIETPTAHVAEGVSTLTNTARPLTEEEIISYETGSISSTSNDAFPVDDDDDDDATDPADKVSDFMIQDLEEGKINEFDRTITLKEDDPNAKAKVNGFIQKGIVEEEDTLSVTDLTEEEDTTASESSNSIEDSVDDNGLWLEGNPDQELNATALILDAFKAKHAWGDKKAPQTFLPKPESVTNAPDSLPGRPVARPTDPREDSTTETSTPTPKEEASKNTL